MTILKGLFEGRFFVFTIVILAAILSFIGFLAGSSWLGFVALLATGLSIVGLHDITQTRRAILRNYPIIGHLRYFFELIRPELRQYFFEADTDGAPFSRDRRAIVYQRAKRQLDKKPFGTQTNVYAEGHEWMLHALMPKPVAKEGFRIIIGGPDCKAPYSASVFNVSAMSYGALSANAIRALNKGAAKGNFAHDTGEGSISPYHREHGGDLIWEIGSGYFGCRNLDGTFSAEKFAVAARDPQIKMIEIKLSQGAKPGHGGVLPAAKVTAEIAEIRGVEQGKDCISPAAHSAFADAKGLMQFIKQLRELSAGKPVGIKLCIGHKKEFEEMVTAMKKSGVTPDFIVIDGKEGGTGAAPAEFIDNVGMPLRDGLAFAHDTLVKAELRNQIKVGCAGKIITGFDMARMFAIGADWCNAARGFMFAVGCIQAQTCHTGKCPTGVTTQDELRQRAIDVPDKADRVYNFHHETLHSLAEMLAAAGLGHPADLKREHIFRRVGDGRVVSFAELYPA